MFISLKWTFIDDEEIQDILFEKEAPDLALKYGTNILKIKKKPLADFIDNEILNKCDICWTSVLSGVGKESCNRIRRLSSCYSQGSIYSISRGYIKPRKHILLGLTRKKTH